MTISVRKKPISSRWWDWRAWEYPVWVNVLMIVFYLSLPFLAWFIFQEGNILEAWQRGPVPNPHEWFGWIKHFGGLGGNDWAMLFILLLIAVMILVLVLIIYYLLSISITFYRSMAEAEAVIVKKDVRSVRGENENELFKECIVTIEFAAAQEGGSFHKHEFEVRVGSKIYSELGITVKVRFARSDPGILLLEGE